MPAEGHSHSDTAETQGQLHTEKPTNSYPENYVPPDLQSGSFPIEGYAYLSVLRNLRLGFSLEVFGAPWVFGSNFRSSTDCVADFSLREAVAEFPSW